MSRERYLAPEVTDAIAAAVPFAPLPFAAVSEVLEVFFPGTGVADVAHGMSAIPDGVLVLLQVGGTVVAANVASWDRTRAYLQASAANTRAIVIFVTFKEGTVKRA